MVHNFAVAGPRGTGFVIGEIEESAPFVFGWERQIALVFWLIDMAW